MNQGLKKYSKQISLTVGNAAQTSINVNKDAANLHIVLPLINTVGPNQIETSLIFNLQDMKESFSFGKGFRLNYYSKISKHSDNLNQVTNSDGSTDLYSVYMGEKNDETGMILGFRQINPYGGYEYQLTDKYGNVSEFDGNQPYPNKIKFKNGDVITSDFIAATRYMDNGKGDVLQFTKNGNDNITLVQYLQDGRLVSSVEIQYDNNQYISNVTYKNGNSTISSTSLKFSSTEIIVVDDLSGYRIKYTISDKKVVSFIDGYDENYTNGHKSSIDYFDSYSVLTNYKGEKTYVFFDEDHMPSFEMDENNNIVETEYETRSKALKSNSGTISFNSIQNLFDSTDLFTFTNNGLKITKVNQSDEKFKGILGDSVYRISGTGSLTKSINYKGLASDNTLAVLFGKQLTKSTNDSYVKVSLIAGGSYADKFNKTTIDNQFELMTLGTTSNISFEKITLKIELVGNAEIEIGGIKVANKEFASFYAYDSEGNVSEMAGGSRTTNMTYGSDNLPTQSIGVDSTYFDYEYDDYGNLLKAKTAYGAKIENTYDTTHKGNLTSNKVTNKGGTMILETKKTYTSDGRFVASSTDELGNVTKYDEYDAFGKIKKVTNALGTISRFNYNDDGTLKQIILESGSDAVGVSYSYDSKKRLSKVTLENGAVYDFIYDSLNNIKQINLNGVIVFAYEYDSNTGNLIKQTYGATSDAYIFEYNEDDLISEIYYEPNGGTKALKFKYFYNGDKQLIKVEDSEGNILNEYKYDANNRVESIKTSNSEVQNTYDNLGNVATKAIIVDKQKYYSAYDTISRSKGSHPGSIYEPFNNIDAYLGMFEKDGVLTSQYANEGILPFINHDYSNPKKDLSVTMDGIIPCVKVNSSNRLSYALTNHSIYNEPCGHISFWFKSDTTTSSSTKKYLFSVHTSYVGNHNTLGNNVLFPDFIGIYLMNKRIYLEAIDTDGIHHDLITSTYEVDLSKWNFVSLNFMNRYDDIGFSNVCEYALVVNAHRQIYKKQDPRLYVDCDHDPVMNIGHKFDGHNSSNDFTGKITGLMIGRRTFLTNDIVNKFYRLTKDYIIDNQLVDSEVKTVDFSQTNLFPINQDVLNMFEIYPLQNSVTSLNGKKPVRYDIRKLSRLDKDRTFNFNAVSKKYSYVADGEELVYEFTQKGSGTIGMRAFTDVSEEKQYFFEAKDINNNVLGLYRDANMYLVVDVNGSTYKSNLKFETNKWQTVMLSFKDTIGSSSMPGEYLDLRVYLDGKTWTKTVKTSVVYENFTISLGRQINDVLISMSLGSYWYSNPFCGQIEMLSMRPAYCELSTLNTLSQELKGLTKVSEFDEFGLLKKVDVHECGKSILSNTYDYKKRSTNSKYISKQISKETIKCGSNTYTRNYETDVLGNITKVSDNIFGNHEYKYDPRGFLIEADGERYSYDQNGNVLKKGNFTLTYDSTIKDRLISFNGIKIDYDSENPLNPTKYGSNSYTFEGRRLVKLSLSGTSYDYIYNDQGLRVKKVDNKGNTWYYTYDGDKLISEISSKARFDFLYDENGSLYGFIKDKTEKYLYLRDCLQNILGIADINGNTIVKYDYDAWGLTKKIEDSSTSYIGDLNPFRYKGYYYDSESAMYYCKTRYYVPLWGRWLNADSPTQIKLLNNNINLYSYCFNNPISGYDSNGNMPGWLSTVFKCIAAVAVVAVACVVSVATAGTAAPVLIGAGIAAGATFISDVADDGQINSGLDAYLGAAVGGAIGGLGSGIVSSGVGDLVEGLFTGEIDSFSEGAIAFAGGMFSGFIGAKISKHVASKGAIKRLKEIIPNFNASNNKINKQLAKAGYKYLKIGRDGLEKIYATIYKEEGY